MPRRDLPAWLLVVLLLAPAAAALSAGGVLPGDVPHVPKVYCAIVQTDDAPKRCDVYGASAQGVTVMRLSIVGEGRAFAYADMDFGTHKEQLGGPLYCEATTAPPSWPDVLALDLVQAAKTCASIVSTSTQGLSGTFDLHVVVDDPGRAVYVGELERVVVSLP